MTYSLLVQVAIYLALVSVKFPAIRAQDFLQIAQSFRERRPSARPMVQSFGVPEYVKIAENFKKPPIMGPIPQGLPDYVRLAESANGYNARNPISANPTNYRTTTRLPPISRKTTTSSPIISALVTKGPTSTTSSDVENYSTGSPMKYVSDDDDSQIFFEDWEDNAQEDADVDYKTLSVVEGRPKFVIKRDHNGRWRPIRRGY